MALLVWVIAGLIAGWLAGMLVRGTSLGATGDLVAGLLGGLVGGFLASQLGAVPANWYGTVSSPAIGAVILVWILHLIHPGVLNPYGSP